MIMRSFGIVLVAIGVAGFFSGNIASNDLKIMDKDFAFPGVHDIRWTPEVGKSYELRVWVIDEASGLQEWATVDAVIAMTDAQGKVLFEKKVSDSKSSSEKTGGISRAQNGITHRWTCEQSGPLRIRIDLKSGDQAEVELYHSLPEYLSLMPGVSIIVGIVGLVLILRARSQRNTVAG